MTQSRRPRACGLGLPLKAPLSSWKEKNVILHSYNLTLINRLPVEIEEEHHEIKGCTQNAIPDMQLNHPAIVNLSWIIDT